MRSHSAASVEIVSLKDGNVAVIWSPAGNIVSIALEANQGASRNRPMLLLPERGIGDFHGPTVVRIPSHHRVALDLGCDFSFDFDPTTDVLAVREEKIASGVGSILLAGSEMIMVAVNGQDLGEYCFINVATGKFVGRPDSGLVVEIASWRLLLHSAFADTNPVTLAECSHHASK